MGRGLNLLIKGTVIALTILCSLQLVGGACDSWPSQWDGTWYDALLQDTVTFTSSTRKASGWNVNTVYGQSLANWECVLQDTTNKYFVFRSVDQIDVFGNYRIGYICIKWTQVTDASYYYYRRMDKDPDALDDTVLIEPASTPLGDTSRFCEPTTPPGVEEFIMIVKQGQEAVFVQYCPLPLMGVFEYSYTTGGSTSCSGGSEWDTCSNRTTMNLDCSTSLAYTSEGTVYCTYFTQIGDSYYLSTFNPGTVDKTSTFYFTCFVIEDIGNNTVAGSVKAGPCDSGATYSSAQSSGGTIHLTPNTLCQPCDPSPCQHNGTCGAKGIDPVCTCLPGYNGTYCEHINPCILLTPCLNGATCNNPSSNVYTCTCSTGYTGNICENEIPCVLSNPCENGGTCTASGLEYTCSCASGYSGTNCTWADPCILSSPCKNGATCANPSTGQYTCACANGYSGTDCENELPCVLSNPCQNGGTCSSPSFGSYTCSCDVGYYGNDCENKRACSFPSFDWDGTWMDSRINGDVTMDIDSSQFHQWSVSISGTNLASWTCVLEDTSNKYYVFRGNNNITVGATEYTFYLCMKWSRLSQYSYLYYLYSDVDADVGNLRLVKEPSNTAKGPLTSYCSPTSPPSIANYHMLIKNGQESSVVQNYPDRLLGTYYYTYENSASTSCGSDSHVDICSYKTRMKFNYTLCSTVIAFSEEGEVWHLYSTETSNVIFITTLNKGNIDNSNSFRFSCLAVASSGTVYISFKAGSCDSSQSPTTIPTNGGKAQYTPYSTCVSSTGNSIPEDPTDSLAPVIAGVVAGILFLILLIVIIAWVIKKKKQTRTKAISQDSMLRDLPEPKDNGVYRLPPLPLEKVKQLPPLEILPGAPLPPLSSHGKSL